MVYQPQKMNMYKLLYKYFQHYHLNINIWASPTWMTLFSLSFKSLSFFLLLPFLLFKLPTEEIALWYLFGIFISLQSLADFGFYNTFVRFISYSLSGGCQSLDDLCHIENQNRKISKPNLELTGDIIGTMNRMYSILSFAIFILLFLLSPLLSNTIDQIETPVEGWYAWIIVIIASTINFYGRKYSNYLLGQNKVALVRKWEALFALFAFISDFIVLFTYSSILLLVISNQVWLVIGLFRNKYLAYNYSLSFEKFKNRKFNKQVFNLAWPFAWKAGISSLTAQGTASASSIVYAQMGGASEIATYLFAIKAITALRSFAQAPFYSKIPLLSQLRGRNEVSKWEQTAQRSMLFANTIMVLGIIIVDIYGAFIFKLFKSNIDFPNHILWINIGFAFLLHRYGAMHTQLYITMNKVNSHINDTVSSVIMVIVWILFYKTYGVMVFPIGMSIGYGLFYIWFAAYYSFKYITLSFYEYEIKANIVPFVIFFIYVTITILTQ
jgi:O-antigen/teichoic acid export membrane protein